MAHEMMLMDFAGLTADKPIYVWVEVDGLMLLRPILKVDETPNIIALTLKEDDE